MPQHNTESNRFATRQCREAAGEEGGRAAGGQQALLALLPGRHIPEGSAVVARLPHHASGALCRVRARQTAQVSANESVHSAGRGAEGAAGAQPGARDRLHTGAHGPDEEGAAACAPRHQGRRQGDRVLQAPQRQRALGGPHRLLGQQARLHHRFAQQHRHARRSRRAHRSHTQRRADTRSARRARQNLAGLSSAVVIARRQQAHHVRRLL